MVLWYCSWLRLKKCIFLFDKRLCSWLTAATVLLITLTAYWHSVNLSLLSLVFSLLSRSRSVSPSLFFFSVSLRVLGPAVTFRVRSNAQKISTAQLARVAGIHKHTCAHTHTHTHHSFRYCILVAIPIISWHIGEESSHSVTTLIAALVIFKV